MIDLHCHILPGVDDGAENLVESKAAITRMRAEGIRQIVVTPHVSTSVLLRAGGVQAVSTTLADAWAGLREMAAGYFPDLTLHRGTELMLDHPHPDLSLEWIRIAGTRFVLLEFPGMMIPPRAADALQALTRSGYTPVVAHPERYRNGGVNASETAAWRAVGVRLQVNCGSLLGQYGEEVRRRAWALLSSGAADYLASDFHGRGDYPIGECLDTLREIGSEEQGKLLLCTNPSRLLQGEDPLEVAPVPVPETGWKKLVRRRLWPS